MSRKKTQQRFIFMCLTPAVLLFTIFMLVPTINVFKMSLFKWGGYTPQKEFVGLNNFKILFQSDNFYQAFQNSLFLLVFVSIFTMALALVMAGIMTREKIKGQSFFRIVFYIPNILSIVVISAIFSAIYDPSNGLLNAFLRLFNSDGYMWLGDQKIVIWSLLFALVWQAIGYYMVIYMSSMAAVPESVYEAAKIDGASRMKQFFEITIPLVWNNIRTTLTFFVLSTVNISFLLVKTMTGGGPDGSTEVFLSYMYKEAYTNSTYGYGMAIGVVIFIFSFVFSLALNQVTKREHYEY